MGLLDLFKRTAPGQTIPLTPAQVDSNWQKIMDLFPTPAAGNTDVGKIPALKSDKTGFEFISLPTAGAGIKRFPKESTLTNSHIGLLAMQKVIALNNDPQGIDDFSIKAVLADTIPATSGTKGEYRLSFSGLIFEQPVSKLVRVTFYHNPLPNNRLVFILPQYATMGALTFKKVGEANAMSNEVEIGNTLHQTITNVVNFFAAAGTELSSECARIDSYNNPAGDGDSHIIFEMQHMKADERKYIDDSYISGENDPFQSGVGYVGGDVLLLQDTYGNQVSLIIDSNPNVDGHFEVIQIGDQAYNNGDLFKQSTGELSINYTGMYFPITNITRDVAGNFFFSSNAINRSAPNIFPLWYSANQTFNINTERSLTINAANNAKGIYDANTQYMLLATSWDSNGNGQTLMSYATVFRNDSGQPNGSFGPFGLRYFTTNNEVIAALNWALNNTQGNWFTTMYDIISPLGYNNGNSSFEMVVRNKTAPMTQASNYFQAAANYGVNINTQTITNAQSGRAERIPYAIIGKVVGIDGTDALIDTSYIFDLKMCSEDDGAFGFLPYSDALNYGNYIPAVVAWRKGTVIDLAGYFTLMQNAGFNGDNILQAPLLVGGYYRPISAAAPDGQVSIDGKFVLFGN